ncbi:phospholipid carrier-dependent glycosyltransferase [Aquipuribacter sp. SD81]|uniref:phospholipid carrier-dependent glycosyltransferase n=1 Tax=Aquipuribacter sp. SD81 TaxID=3127703 RepID=UPI0030179F7F
MPSDTRPRPTPLRAGHASPGGGWSVTGLVVLLGVVLVGGLARLWRLPTAYDLFIDEVTYTDIARSVAAGEGVLLHGEPFFLHPAGVFWVLAGAERLLGLQDAGLAASAYSFRVVPALLGALTPGVLALVVRTVTRSWPAAAAAGLVLALEPFLLRFDSRVLLEAQAMLLAAAALLVAARASRRAGDGRPATLLPVGVGLLACGALLSKETYAFVSVFPLAVLLVTGWGLPRRSSAVALGTAVTGYLLYVASVAADGLLGVWFEEKTTGVRRLLGLVQETGFNREGSPGFVDRLVANLGVLGSTYLLIGLGGVATAWLVWRLWRRRPVPVERGPLVVLLVWVACGDAHAAYALTLGTLEEQMFYLLVATAVPVLAVAATVALRVAGAGATTRSAGTTTDGTSEGTPDSTPDGTPDGTAGARRRATGVRAGSRSLAAALAVGTALLLVWEAGVWWRLRSVPDDGYLRLLEWTATGLPDGARVATTEETLQFLLDDHLVQRLGTGAEVREFGASHVLVVSELVDQGYSEVDDELAALVEDGDVVFRSSTRTVGELLVVELAPDPAAD